MFRSFEYQPEAQKLQKPHFQNWLPPHYSYTFPAISKRSHTYLLLMKVLNYYFFFFFLVNSGVNSEVTVYVLILICAFCQAQSLFMHRFSDGGEQPPGVVPVLTEPCRSTKHMGAVFALCTVAVSSSRVASGHPDIQMYTTAPDTAAPGHGYQSHLVLLFSYCPVQFPKTRGWSDPDSRWTLMTCCFITWFSP